MWRRESGLVRIGSMTSAIWSTCAAVGRRPGPPLVAVDRAEVAGVVGPLVPDRDAALLQPAHVGVAAQEPQQLADDRAHVQLLGRDDREALGQVEAHLVAEHAARAGAGAVGLVDAVRQDVVEEVEVLPHARSLHRGADPAGRARRGVVRPHGARPCGDTLGGMTSALLFGRVLTAMVTPMSPTAAGRPRGHRRASPTHLVGHGHDGVVVSGTTGESPTTSSADESTRSCGRRRGRVGDRATGRRRASAPTTPRTPSSWRARPRRPAPTACCS